MITPTSPKAEAEERHLYEVFRIADECTGEPCAKSFRCFQAGHSAASSRWIPISERLPTKEERDGNVILWWYEYTESAWPGELYIYDGKYVQISMRHWNIQESLAEFTHWCIQQPLPLPPTEQP